MFTFHEDQMVRLNCVRFTGNIFDNTILSTVIYKKKEIMTLIKKKSSDFMLDLKNTIIYITIAIHAAE